MKQRTNDIRALHDKKLPELQTQLQELQVALVEARLSRKVGKLEDTASVQRLSDAIARIKTIMREKQLRSAAKKVAKKDN